MLKHISKHNNARNSLMHMGSHTCPDSGHCCVRSCVPRRFVCFKNTLVHCGSKVPLVQRTIPDSSALICQNHSYQNHNNNGPGLASFFSIETFHTYKLSPTWLLYYSQPTWILSRNISNSYKLNVPLATGPFPLPHGQIHQLQCQKALLPKFIIYPFGFCHPLFLKKNHIPNPSLL